MGVRFLFVSPILIVCYLGLAIVILLKRRVKAKAERALLVYLLATAAWNAVFALSTVSPASETLTRMGEQAVLGGLVILAVIFLNLTHAFLKQHSRYTAAWWILGIVSTLIVFLSSPGTSSDVTLERITIGRREIVQMFSVFAWGGFKLAAIFATWRVFRQTVSPMHRNRYRYWLLSVALLIVGDLFFATMLPLARPLGGVINLTSALAAAMAILRYRLVDIKSLFRQAFGYVTVTLLTIAINLLVVLAAFRIGGEEAFLAALIGVGVTSIVFSFTVSPARRAIQRMVDRKLFHLTADHETALRNYRDHAIERLKLESLGDLVIETLLASMSVSRGGLYLVTESKREIGGLLLHLIRGEGDLPTGDLELHPDSVLVARLTGDHAPLTQYEIDIHQDFRELPADERALLRALTIEVLVPIYTPSRLVGLIVLGAKGSGESYAPSDIEWLEALAAHTAVALENARLFDQVESMSVSVMRLNVNLERAYYQLREVDRLKSAFIGVITHELRSPFVAASLSIELLHRYLSEGMTAELAAQVQQLDKELGQGRRMIDSVISFASLLGKQGKLHLEQTDVAELVQNTVKPLEQVARSRHIRLSCTCSRRLAQILADKTRLSEAIYHLVHNAVKFNHEGGSVRVSCWPTDTHVVFKVQDTGRGICPEDLANIWQVFTQAADDVQRGVEGLGLGLALVKFVVEAHHGEVWATSKIGAGSTFGFRVPRALEIPDLAPSL